MEQLILKFGDVKGGNFSNNDEALRLFTEERFKCITDYDYRQNALKVVEAFDGEFLIWWGEEKVTKEKAIDYILNYQSKL